MWEYACMLVHCTTSHSMERLQCYVCHGMEIQGGVVWLVFHNRLVYVLIDMCL